jgi:hypothetical protein
MSREYSMHGKDKQFMQAFGGKSKEKRPLERCNKHKMENNIKWLLED